MFIGVFGENFCVFPTNVKGASMRPTLQDGDKVIVNKLAKQFESYGREDIIVMKTDNFYVKRVIGLPGDIIEMRNDQLYVNSEVKDEEYLDSNKNKQKKTYEFNRGLWTNYSSRK